MQLHCRYFSVPNNNKFEFTRDFERIKMVYRRLLGEADDDDEVYSPGSKPEGP
jgi:hypothetical protein